MAEISGVCIWNHKPINGAVAKLWKATGFATPPVFDEAEPDAGYQEGSDVTTAYTNGSDGSFRFTSVPAGQWYVSVEYDGHRAWLYFGEPDIDAILTTQGDLLVKGASALERLAKGSNGQKLYMVSGSPAWV